MGAIPGDIETDTQPPMAIPLRHFLVGLSFLLAGVAVGAVAPLGVVPGVAGLAHVHLLLAGWVCVTIQGAMTQFVPVWSGTTLHSRRLARIQLWTVTAGLVGFAGCLLAEAYALLPAVGGLALAGFWTFAYNVGRTLATARPWDVTERHFAVALGFLVVATGFGALLTAGYTRPVLAGLPVARTGLREAHATLAVFGAVLVTVFGALYQLATMFTQSALHGVDVYLRRVETVGYPVGVVALAAGRLVGAPAVARVGALLVLVGVAAMGVVLARRLLETAVEWTPMLRRYAVAAVAMLGWAVLSLPAWIADPLHPAATFGAPGAAHLLAFGAVGFVVAGTLYHVVPFIVWVHRYSDRLGLEPVPMIDDLYDARLAAVDFAALSVGSATLVTAELLSVAEPLPIVGELTVPPVAVALAGGVAAVGVVAFAVNLGRTVRRHSPASVLPGGDTPMSRSKNDGR
ncbi:hypothetical protein [Halobellus ruber]|uniref:Cbb3-type cytochrome c oxidase subunit I n=1 Tax=Halobellus ruber TaxID=2761102 RepID=A0A7J9SKP7_9EURY|nr:hypothetical protein [Halobellus ruber]MBB6646689.1 hypothetical protein [Halobellus ruber]